MPSSDGIGAITITCGCGIRIAGETAEGASGRRGRRGGAGAGATGHAVDARGLQGFGQTHGRQDGGQPPRQPRLSPPEVPSNSGG
jgi:hypothetical protein